MCYKGRRRRRKQAALVKYMKRKCVITLQDVHGSESLLRTWIDTQPYPYKVFFSEFPSVEGDNSTGGAAALIPWLSPMELEQLQPHQLPLFNHDELVDRIILGYILWLRVYLYIIITLDLQD